MTSAGREGAADMSPDPDKVPVEVEGRTLVLTNLTKVLYPDQAKR